MAKKSLGKGLEALIKTQNKNKMKIDTYIVYKEAVSKAYADGIFTHDEKAILKELAKSLGLISKERDIIIDEVKEENNVTIEEEEKKELSEETKVLYALKIEKEALEKEIKLYIKEERSLHKKLEKSEELVETLNSKIKNLEEENKEVAEQEQIYKEKVKDLEVILQVVGVPWFPAYFR